MGLPKTVLNLAVLIVSARIGLTTSSWHNSHSGDKVLAVLVPNKETWKAVWDILTKNVNVQGSPKTDGNILLPGYTLTILLQQLASETLLLPAQRVRVFAVYDLRFDVQARPLRKPPHDLKTKNIDIWQYPDHANTAQIYVPSADYTNVSRDFGNSGIQFEVNINDLGSLIAGERLSKQQVYYSGHRKGASYHNHIFHNYPTYGQVLSWIEDVSGLNRHLVETVSIGKTVEGRPMMAIKIGTKGRNKNSIWIDGAIHAREWITVTTAIYIADQLIEGYRRGDARVKKYLQNFDFYVLPVANPDGYAFSHQDANNRLWRKNRAATSNPNCLGVDLNRNWNFKWNSTGRDSYFTSGDPCSNVYIGPRAESELEVKNMVAMLTDKRKNFIAYITLHSYSQLFLSPYSYDKVFPKDHDYLLAVAKNATKAMFLVHRKTYRAGTAAADLYTASGVSADWAKGYAKVTYAYLLELRGELYGKHGFLLPPDQIIPTGEEVWAGMEVVFDAALEKFKEKSRSPLKNGAVVAFYGVIQGAASILTIVALLLI